jgi:alkylation response protein AidB-like acyl-CoA dehydrogenase
MTLAKGSGASALVFNMHASVTGALAQTPDGLASSLGAPAAYFAFRDAVLSSARDGAFFAVAMSERGAGSRLSSLSTTYHRTAAGLRFEVSRHSCPVPPRPTRISWQLAPRAIPLECPISS